MVRSRVSGALLFSAPFEFLRVFIGWWVGCCGAGHEFGHTMGLPHTDEYGVQLPSNWKQSIMYWGNGTQSLFFPFEVERLRSFLTNWH